MTQLADGEGASELKGGRRIVTGDGIGQGPIASIAPATLPLPSFYSGHIGRFPLSSDIVCRTTVVPIARTRRAVGATA
jgi:hypothetical protein